MVSAKQRELPQKRLGLDTSQPMVSADHSLSVWPLSISRHYFSFPRWFKFERAVDALVAKHTYFMNLDQLLSVIRQVCQIEDEEEVTAMLNFYHDLGVIVKHGQTVVLQAQWLIDLFKQLITVRPFDEAVSVVDYSCISVYCLPSSVAVILCSRRVLALRL